MTQQAEQHVAVGSYLDRERADAAAASLREAGFAEVDVHQPSDDVWQVLTPQLDARRAVEQLQSEQQHGMQTHF